MQKWPLSGGPAFIDLRPPQIPADHRHFWTRPRLVRYWAAVSRVALAEQGREVTTEAVREFQRTELASRQGDTCLVELLPLPSPTTGQWMYGEHSDLPELRSRGTYLDQIVPLRRKRLGDLIRAHRPRYVVFLSTGYLEHWNAAVQRRVPVWPDAPVTDELTGTKLLAARHPSSHGVTNADFDAIGRALAT